MRRALVMLSLAVVWGAPGESAGSDRSDKRMAKAHVAQGMDHYRAGRYDEAVLEFRKAREFVTSPALVWNMARAYEELGDIRNAVHYFEDLVTEWPDDESAEEAEEAQERLDDLRPKAPGSLLVECGEVRGGRVILDEDDDEDGRECDAKFPSVTPGVHAVRIEVPGRKPWLGNVRVAAGKRASVQASWRRRGRAKAKRKRRPRVSEGRGLNWTAVAITAAAVGLAAGAAVFHLRSEGAVEDYEALHDRDSVTGSEVQAQADSANRDATLAASMLGVALVTGGVAGWAWTW